jgi:hypothetical protein
MLCVTFGEFFRIHKKTSFQKPEIILKKRTTSTTKLLKYLKQ